MNEPEKAGVDPGDARFPDQASTTDAHDLARPRMNIELRVLGLLATTWLCSATLGGSWLWLSAAPWDPTPWFVIVVPPSVLLLVALAICARRLPLHRWLSQVPGRRAPSPIPLLFFGFPAIAATPILLSHARASQNCDPETRHAAATPTFRQLLAYPRLAATVTSACFAASALIQIVALSIVGSLRFDLLLLVCTNLLLLIGPIAVILVTRIRAILRPELRAIPVDYPTESPESRKGQLRSRLIVPALIAAIASIAGPLASVELWSHRDDLNQSISSAQSRAAEALETTDAQSNESLGRFLAEHPDLTIFKAGRRYGKNFGNAVQANTAPGPVDTNNDNLPDLWVAHAGSSTAVVPFLTPTTKNLLTTILAAVISIGIVCISIVSLTTDVAHDTIRTSGQVSAVARGAIPPPLREDSFNTLELRQLVNSVDRLVTRITENNMEKYISIEKAAEADRLKSQFLANMSHDLRSPLNSILGFSELLVTGIDGKITDEQTELVNTIHQSGRILLRQIDDILDMAKIEARRMEIHPETVPPITLVGRAIYNARKHTGDSIQYTTETAPGLPTAMADPYRTVQAIENVLVFASERLDAGTLNIRVSSENLNPGRVIRVVVTTPHSPASADELSRVLRGFFRIPGHQGLGLGLPIAANIMELQGGVLGIIENDTGMDFVLDIPSPKPKPKPKPKQQGSVLGSVTGRHRAVKLST